MLSTVNGQTLLAKRQQALLIFAEMRNVIVIVEGAAIERHLDCTSTKDHIRFINYNHGEYLTDCSVPFRLITVD